MENSFHSRGSKNFVLKSDYLNTSKHNSKKNLSFYDNNNGQNQKAYSEHHSLLLIKKKKIIKEKG